MDDIDPSELIEKFHIDLYPKEGYTFFIEHQNPRINYFVKETLVKKPQEDVSINPVELEKINDPEVIKARLHHLSKDFYLYFYSRPAKDMESADITRLHINPIDEKLESETISWFMDNMSTARKSLGVIIVPQYVGNDSEKIEKWINAHMIADQEGNSYMPPFLNVGWTTPKGKVFSFSPLYSGKQPNEKLLFEKLSQLELLVKEREKELSTFEDGEGVLSYDEEGNPKDEMYRIIKQTKKEITIQNGGIPISRKRNDIDFLAQDESKEWITKTDDKWFAIHKKYEEKIIDLLRN